MRRLAAAALALAVATPCFARPQASSVEADNARRARAGLLPRKVPPPKGDASARPAEVATPPVVSAHPPPVAPVEVPRPIPTAGGILPPPPPPAPSGPLDAAVVAGRALASAAETAPAQLAIDAVPVAVRALTVTSTIRVRAGRVTLVVEPQRR